MKSKKHNDRCWKIEVYKPSETYYDHSNGWLIGFDHTDHFQFFCPKCKDVAKVTSILPSRAVAGTIDSDGTLHLHLICENCKISGQRKIYFGDRDSSRYCNQSINKEILDE